MTLTAGLVLALVSTAALSAGFYLQHAASGPLPALSLQPPLASLSALFTDRRWVGGFVTGLGGWALYIVALGLAPIALVQATSAGGVGLLALLVQRSGGHCRAGTADRSRVRRRPGAARPVASGGCRAGGAPGSAAPLGWVLASAMLAIIAAIPAAPYSGQAPGSRWRPGCCTQPATSRPRQQWAASARCTRSPC